jgi:hypothetical protein
MDKLCWCDGRQNETVAVAVDNTAKDARMRHNHLALPKL